MKYYVALLAEGVDRNYEILDEFSHYEVALLAEGVDRNSCLQVESNKPARRPPRGGRG